MNDTSPPFNPDFNIENPEGEPSDYDKMLLNLIVGHSKLMDAQTLVAKKLMMEIARLTLKLNKLEDKINERTN